MRKIGALYAGNAFHYKTLNEPKFAQFIEKIIYLPDLAETSLADLAVLWIPSQLPLALLEKNKEKIRDFADNGGTVAVFGPQPIDLVPNLTWHDGVTNFWWWTQENPDSGLKIETPSYPIFNYLTLADCTWHQHGHFDLPKGAVSLISKDDSGVIFYVDKLSSKGNWVVTCLDPDYHYGAYFMPATERMLEGMLLWLAYGEI
ncbi:hypothetical protein Hs30E_06790 [Lactococcus hodotermopsidis]|uniref:ThuA-like domain-containing protein n=1 Tax=Pseudolactococcus hodotermopsidis TaxID=2709157 RepID=A0A6A0BCN4_9LACT|nr:hypothetical protein [Lactococcus hodotermopsidis]GFH42128.1 hypothetical protein Hs30E_06790 [Lactococcus hodotermopsidis]